MQFCCNQMAGAVADDEIPIVYVPKLREFGVRVLDGGQSSIQLHACPWCGTTLAESLRDQWFDELARRGIDPARDAVPPEFADERWWSQVRGL